MTTFKNFQRDKKHYLYVCCPCGSQHRVPEKILANYMAETNSRHLSMQVKRGIEAALRRGEPVGRPTRRSNGHHTHKSN